MEYRSLIMEHKARREITLATHGAGIGSTWCAKKEEKTGVFFVAVCVLCESFRLCNAYALYQACAARGVPFCK